MLAVQLWKEWNNGSSDLSHSHGVKLGVSPLNLCSSVESRGIVRRYPQIQIKIVLWGQAGFAYSACYGIFFFKDPLLEFHAMLVF